MKLSEIDRRIIQLVEHHADVSVEAIARAIKAKVHTTRYALNRLIACGVLNRQYLLNLHQIGLQQYVITCTLNGASRSASASFLEHCCRSARVSYVLELVGDFQLQVGFYALNSEDAERFLIALGEKFPRIFRTKIVFQVLRLFEFGSRALHNKPVGRRLFHFGYTGGRHAIDKLDHEILKGLAGNSVQTISQLARAVGAPVTTVNYRLTRLRSAGIISGCRYLIDMADDILRTFRLLVDTRGLTLRLRENLLRYCERNSQIGYLADLLGPWDFELGVRAISLNEIHSMVDDIKEVFDLDISDIKVLTCFKLHKLNKYPFDICPT